MRTTTPSRWLIPAALALVAAPAAFLADGRYAPAAAQGSIPGQEAPGNAERGHEVARQRCAECHVIAEGEGRQQGNAPAFDATADDNDAGNLRLLSNLENALIKGGGNHPALQGPRINRQELRDLVAYMRREHTGDQK